MNTNEKQIVVGGQAVIEGVMMRTPNAYAVAVRRADGSVVYTGARLPKWSDQIPLLKMPVLRGAAVLIQSMALGIKALNYSASEAYAEEELKAAEFGVTLKTARLEGQSSLAGITGAVPTLLSVPTEKHAKDEFKRSAFGSIIFALFFNVLLFIVAPLVLTNAVFVAAGWDSSPQTFSSVKTFRTTSIAESQNDQVAQRQRSDAARHNSEAWYMRGVEKVRVFLRPVRPSVAFNLLDGSIRMFFFLVMIFCFSLLKDIRRVFEYHGAEHKTVFTWEAGLPLTIEQARGQSRLHPRCGTSFLMVVMLVSILFFSLVRFDSLIYNLLARIALLPVVAGIAYEIIRSSARSEGSIIFKLITMPGLWLQNITTKEPDDDQLEVAIIALKESLKLEPQMQEVAAAPLA